MPTMDKVLILRAVSWMNWQYASYYCEALYMES